MHRDLRAHRNPPRSAPSHLGPPQSPHNPGTGAKPNRAPSDIAMRLLLCIATSLSTDRPAPLELPVSSDHVVGGVSSGSPGNLYPHQLLEFRLQLRLQGPSTATMDTLAPFRCRSLGLSARTYLSHSLPTPIAAYAITLTTTPIST